MNQLKCCQNRQCVGFEGNPNGKISSKCKYVEKSLKTHQIVCIKFGYGSEEYAKRPNRKKRDSNKMFKFSTMNHRQVKELTFHFRLSSCDRICSYSIH